MKYRHIKGPLYGPNPKHSLTRYEYRVYSQNGEDGILAEIFRRLKIRKGFSVEFGVEDGTECNTRYLGEQGWQTLMLDGADYNKSSIKKELITAENIGKVFAKYGVPADLDLLSIDIDSNDYWVWKALPSTYKPRVVVIEYNSMISPTEPLTVRYDKKLQWDGSNYFGAGILALATLGKEKGYNLVCCDSRGVNAFFVRQDLSSKFQPLTAGEAYRAPLFGTSDKYGNHLGHPASSKKMQRL